MKAVLTIYDDEGNKVLDHQIDPLHSPSQLRLSSDKILKSGHYEFYGLTIQPHVRSLYPNGYQAEQAPFIPPPVPSPFTGLKPASILSGQPKQIQKPAPDEPASGRVTGPSIAPRGF